MKSGYKKITVAVTGLLLILILMESALRIMGYIAQKEAASGGNAKDEGKGSFTILCVGDSFTRGIGAAVNMDYPTRLQQMLDSVRKDYFRVVNTSVAGRNTIQILNALEPDIEKFKPDLIVLLMGGANNWNFWGYNAAMHIEGARSSFEDFMNNFRLYRLATLLVNNVKDKLSKPSANNANFHFEEERYKIAFEKFRAETGSNPANGQSYYDMGAFFMYERDVPKAIEYFKKGINAAPKFLKNYLALASAYHELGEFSKPIEWFQKAIEAKVDGIDHIYALLGAYYLKDGHYKESIGYIKDGMKYNTKCGNYWQMLCTIRDESKDYQAEAAELIKKFPPVSEQIVIKFGDMNFNNPPIDKTVFNQDKSLVTKWVRSGLTRAIEICRDRNIKLIMMNYPLRGFAWNSFSLSYKLANGVIDSVARENQVAFIDQKQSFDKLGTYRKDYIEPPGLADHCNEKGYQLMAKNVMGMILSMGVLSKNAEAINSKNLAQKKDPEKLIETGAQKASSGKLKEAIEDFTTAIQLDSGYSKAYNDRGHAWMDMGNFEMALKDYNKAIQIDPYEMNNYNNRGFLFIKAGKYKEAIKDYDFILQGAPQHAIALSNRAFAKMKLRNLKGAMTDINSSIEYLPDNSWAYRNRALIWLEMKNKEKACSDLKKALELGFTRDFGNEVLLLSSKVCGN